MKPTNQKVEKYNSATLFVFYATIVVLIELVLMRILIPSSAGASEPDAHYLMEQVCTTENLVETKENLEVWSVETTLLTSHLSCTSNRWQKPLASNHAFGSTKIHQEVVEENNERKKYIDAAKYAAKNLSLQSVMTGRTILANINGIIYQEGDSILMRDGEIVMDIVELGSTYAIVQLAEHDVDGDTRFTIHLVESFGVVYREPMP